MENIVEEENVIEEEKLPLREHSFEAEKEKKLQNIHNAYELLGEKITDLEELVNEEYLLNDGESEPEENPAKKEIEEDIAGIKRYIRKLRSEVQELNMLIFCRDEKEEDGLTK